MQVQTKFRSPSRTTGKEDECDGIPNTVISKKTKPITTPDKNIVLRTLKIQAQVGRSKAGLCLHNAKPHNHYGRCIVTSWFLVSTSPQCVVTNIGMPSPTYGLTRPSPWTIYKYARSSLVKATPVTRNFLFLPNTKL